MKSDDPSLVARLAKRAPMKSRRTRDNTRHENAFRFDIRGVSSIVDGLIESLKMNENAKTEPSGVIWADDFYVSTSLEDVDT